MIFISIFYFIVWTRPPDVTFNGVEAPLTGTEVGVQKNGFLLNFGLNVSFFFAPLFIFRRRFKLYYDEAQLLTLFFPLLLHYE